MKRQGNAEVVQDIENLIKGDGKRAKPIDSSNDRNDVQGKEFDSLVFSHVYEIFVPIRVRVEYDMRKGCRKGRLVVRDDAVSPLCRLFPALSGMISQLEPYLSLEKTEKKSWQK